MPPLTLLEIQHLHELFAKVISNREKGKHSGHYKGINKWKSVLLYNALTLYVFKACTHARKTCFCLSIHIYFRFSRSSLLSLPLLFNINLRTIHKKNILQQKTDQRNKKRFCYFYQTLKSNLIQSHLVLSLSSRGLSKKGKSLKAATTKHSHCCIQMKVPFVINGF